MSFPRKRESRAASNVRVRWTPAFAGVTGKGVSYDKLIQIVLVCRYWSSASAPLSRASEPERL
jgi:hypothetical protein